MTCNLLLRGLDILAEPDTLNSLTLSIVASVREPSTPESSSPPPPPPLSVQLLKHWCYMNGSVFKSIQAPTLKEIMTNADTLHVFIGYLNTLNSLPVLKLCVALSKSHLTTNVA